MRLTPPCPPAFRGDGQNPPANGKARRSSRPAGLWLLATFCACVADALWRRGMWRDHVTLSVQPVALGVVAEAVLVAECLLMGDAALPGRDRLGLLIHRLKTRGLALIVTRARLRRRRNDCLGARRARNANQRKRKQGMSDH